MTQINDLWLPAVSKSAELNLNISQLRLNQLELVTIDERAREKVQERLDEINNNLMIYFKVFEPLVQTQKQSELYEAFKVSWEKYSAVYEEFNKNMAEKKGDAAQKTIRQSSDVFSEMSAKLTDLTDVSFLEAIKASEASQVSFKFGIWFLGIAVFSCLVISLSLAFVTLRYLKRSLGQVSQSLEETSGALRERSVALANSSQELSASSTESAASLQETVASMEELSITVKSNSDKANTASELSDVSQSAVIKGRQKIIEMISSMKKVSEASQKIDEVVAIIDDIAFQTNLLALNAAVEAARAGEQGKGFMVVADSVRNLAQRCLGSASEIKSLVVDAKEKTDISVGLASESDKSLEEIVKAVEKLTLLIKEVALESQNQTLGLNQVSIAMNQIDQATQELNLSTQKISSTAMEMDHKAESLRQLMVDLQQLCGVN